MPVRRRVDPLLVQVVENNVILRDLVQQVKDVAAKQELNHVVALALADHKTIERVDELWDAAGKVQAVVEAQTVQAKTTTDEQTHRITRQIQIFLGIPGLVVATLGVLTFGHTVLHWFE